MNDAYEPCPFCGQPTRVRYWHSHLLACVNLDAIADACDVLAGRDTATWTLADEFEALVQAGAGRAGG